MYYKKPTPEYIQIIADDVAWRNKLIKEDQEFKAKLRNYLKSLIKDK